MAVAGRRLEFDKKASGYRSSFNESLPPMWGLHEYWAATGETRAREAAQRTAELFLEHRLFRVLATGEPIRESFVTVHSPPFWHYDFVAGARRARPDEARGRPARGGRPRPARGEKAPGRPLARRRPLVEGAGLEGQ